MSSLGAYAICCYLLITVGSIGLNRQTEENSEEVLLDVRERALRHGYSASEHTVETEDGYILTFFRLQRPEGAVRSTPVLVMHGLMQCAAMWIDAGPGVALAYLLADAGHDVWLGNVRGTLYSRNHAWLNPDTDAQYWQFSVDEIGRYDHPPVIDYILSLTSAPKLNYIGFSQGGGTFFIMCSEKPEYREKINFMIGLAPATRHLRTKSVVFNTLTQHYEKHEEMLHKYGVWEVLSKGGLIQSFLENFCPLSDLAIDVCEALVSFVDAPNPGSLLKSALPTAVASMPAGTSVHNMARYGQSTKTQNFQKYNYGPEQNMMLYGSSTPPLYNLSAVTVPTVVLYGRNDGIVDIRDVKWLLRRLPNVLEAFEVKDPLWTHLDFHLSKYIPQLMFSKIEEYLDKFSGI